MVGWGDEAFVGPYRGRVGVCRARVRGFGPDSDPGANARTHRCSHTHLALDHYAHPTPDPNRHSNSCADTCPDSKPDTYAIESFPHS